MASRLACTLLVTASGLLASPSAPASASDGTFLLMSREGAGEWQQADQRWRSLPPLFHIAPISNTAWRTGSNDKLLLGLSNRSVLVVAPESQLRVTHFTQEPFIDASPQPELEPSGSNLQIAHESGRLLLKAGELRANSSVLIRCQHGELRLISGTILIETDSNATRLWMWEGSASFTPSGGERVFLTGGTSYHYQMGRSPLRYPFDDVDLEDSIAHLQRAASSGFARLAVLPAGENGLTRAESRYNDLPRARIVQTFE